MAEEKKITKEKEVTPREAESSKLASLEKELAELKDNNKKLQNMLLQLLANKATSTVTPVTASEPTIVYTSVSPGYIGIPNAGISFKCTKYGETFSVSRHQLDAIVGQYRKWFEDGRLALADKDAGVAKEKGIPTVGSFFLTKDTLANLGKLSTTELQNLWNKITLPEQRESLVHYYKQKYMEGDPEFKNREKIELLNRLTENGFASEAREVSGYGTKLTPKVFM